MMMMMMMGFMHSLIGWYVRIVMHMHTHNELNLAASWRVHTICIFAWTTEWRVRCSCGFCSVPTFQEVHGIERKQIALLSVNSDNVNEYQHSHCLRSCGSTLHSHTLIRSVQKKLIRNRCSVINGILLALAVECELLRDLTLHYILGFLAVIRLRLEEMITAYCDSSRSAVIFDSIVQDYAHVLFIIYG